MPHHRIVHQNIDGAGAAEQIGHHGFYGSALRQVGCDAYHADAKLRAKTIPRLRRFDQIVQDNVGSRAGKADRVAVAEALRSMDAGPSKYYPLGEIKFDEKGRRVGAGMTIVQWQSGVPVTVFPPQLALSQPFWPKN